MNKIYLIGNLTRDPEAATTQSNVPYTRFSIAVNRLFANANGERIADYFDIITWRQLAENCSRYLSKGMKVAVIGSVQRRQYEDREGVKRTSFDIVADEVEFLSPKNSQGVATPPQGGGKSYNNNYNNHNNGDSVDELTPVSDDELPF